MTVLEIEGKQVEVDDGFLKLSPEQQNATVKDIATQMGIKSAAPPAEPDTGITANKVVRSAAEGVPIVGGTLNRLNAATNATLAPVVEPFMEHSADDISREGEGWSDRYAKSLEMQNRQSRQMEQQHPIVDTAAKLAGGTAAFVPLASSGVAARALGMSGTLPQMVTRGALSGAAIGAADEPLRGGSALHGAETGAITGAGFPVAGRIIGGAVRSLRGTAAMPRERPTADVNGVEVPQWESVRTGDNAAGSQEQAAFSGAMGPDAQRIAQEANDARNAAMEQARTKFGAELAPATDPRLGADAGTVPDNPHIGADQAVTELADRYNRDLQQRALRGIAGDVSDTQLRQSVAPQPPPGTLPQQPPQPPQMPATAQDATAVIGQRIPELAQQAAQTRTAAYQRAGQIEGEFDPAGFARISNSIVDRLNTGPAESRVRINDRTPIAREALDVIENEIGSGRTPTNLAQRGTMTIGPDGRPTMPPITGRDVEAVRQQLVPLMRDANMKARGPNPDATDARAMRRIMEAFDSHVRDVVRAGGFSGDGRELLGAYDAARAAHSNYRGTFSARGSGDFVGPVIEKIIGKHPGQQMTPEQIAGAMYTPGGNSVAVAQRLRNIVGENSQEWGAAKQGYLSHLLDTPAGTAPLSPQKQADNIYNAVNGKGNSLSQAYLSQDERQRLLQHADLLRTLVPHDGPLNDVDKVLMKLSGVDGSVPGTSREMLSSIMSPSSGTPTAMAPRLVDRLKQTLSPESWDGLRQDVWEALTTRPEGMLEFGPQAINTRLSKFLDDPVAKKMFNDKELQLMRIIQQEYRKMIPLANTTNPSGSGVMLSKMLRHAQGNLLPMLGMAVHGPAGVLGGFAGNKAVSFVANRRAVTKTMDLFHGRRLMPAHGQNAERAAAILAKAAQPLAAPTGQ